MLFLVPVILALFQSSGAELLARGQELFLGGNYPEAVGVLRRAAPLLEESDDRLEVHLTLALIHEAQADDARTLLELQWALAEKPDLVLDPDLYSPKTRALLDRARAGAFERLLSAKKDFATGDLTLALEEFRLAAALLSREAESDRTENVLDALLNAALIDQTLGNEHGAKVSFRRALTLRPDLTLDSDFYSPTTVALFREVKGEAERVLGQARAALRGGKPEEALALLESGEGAFFDSRQKIEGRLLASYGLFLRGEREHASEELSRVIEEQPSVGLDEGLFDASFVDLADNLRVVATRGLPRIAIVQSSASAVHEASRRGFEEVTLAEIETFVLAEDEETAISASDFDLVYALGADAFERATACCRELPLVVANLPAATSIADESDGAPRGGILWNVTVSGQITVALRALPAARRVGVVIGPDGGRLLAEELEKGLASYAVELVVREARAEAEVPQAVEAIVSDIDLFWYLPDPVLASVTTFDAVRKRCDRAGKPIFAFHESLVQAGAYVGVSADFASLGRQAGRMAVSYLSTRAADALRIVPADASRIVLNLASAARLGIDPDPTLISLAGAVYR